MNFEKRKNSDRRQGMPILMAVALVLAGIFVGLVMNGDTPSHDTTIAIDDINLSGEWVGTTTEDYGEEVRYDYRIIISQDNGNISGIGILDMVEELDIYAEERIEGYVEGNQIVYSEVETMVLENLSMDYWCHTQSTLTYQIINGQETLVGEWEYVLGQEADCEGISGRVILTRQ